MSSCVSAMGRATYFDGLAGRLFTHEEIKTITDGIQKARNDAHGLEEYTQKVIDNIEPVIETLDGDWNVMVSPPGLLYHISNLAIIDGFHPEHNRISCCSTIDYLSTFFANQNCCTLHQVDRMKLSLWLL